MSKSKQMEVARDVLHERFQLGDFRPGQEAVISALLDGRSALAVFPTGGGKSLCYQLPALLLDGVTLVVSPLIALMKDQVDGLQALGIPAAKLDSTMGADEQAAVMAEVRAGRVRLLYVAPERLANRRFLTELEGLNLAMMAIDEAHCISEWGHNFRPDYLRLERLAKTLRPGRVLALTATATPEVSAGIRAAFGIAGEDHVQTGFRRPNLDYRITPCDAAQRKERLLERLAEVEGAAIVYVTQQVTAEGVAGFLKRNGVDAKAYHAGLRDDYRAEVQEAFMAGEVRVVVATIAFGMGIDKADIRAVIHFNLPKSLENYVQETGRAGRDGEPARCEMLACADDLTVLENFIYGDTPTPQALRHLVDHLLRLGDEFDVSRWHLSGVNDIRSAVVETVLAYLELDGVLEPVGSFFGSFRFYFVRSLDSALAGYDDGRKKFLTDLIATGREWRGTTTVDTEQAAQELGVERAVVVEAITALQEAGDVNLRPYGVRHRYQIGQRPGDIGAVVSRMQELFGQREMRDVSRLREVVALAEEEGCIVGRLLAYFGEQLEVACGRCSRCTGDQSGGLELPGSEGRELAPEEVEAVQSLAGEKHAALRSPRQLARFLCGISSPAATRARLGKHDAFGLLEDVSFQEVLTTAESLSGI
jgi:ATP-dependent DNA helicase RecQ